MKKFTVLLAGAMIGLLASFAPAFAATPVVIDVLERQDCGHCQDEKAFLNELATQRDDIQIVYRDIVEEKYKDQFVAVAEQLKLTKATPITIINGIVVQGFGTPETTGQALVKIIDSQKEKPAVNFEKALEAKTLVASDTAGATCADGTECETGLNEYWVSIPFYGQVEVLQYSLPFMSLILGFVDGFNPCAMWVLLIFLTLLAETGSRRRMFQMAGLFILAEAIMYYLILNVWMTAWDFVGMDRIVTPIVGMVATGAGSWFLYLFYKADTTCKVGDFETKRKTTEKIKKYVDAPMTLFVALGILGVAFSVNIIEFACSIGIPQTFTKILDINYLTWVGKQWYNALYILMYMIDDLIVFGLALYSFDKIGLTTHKYTRASHLIGGALMLLLGLIMLFKPSLLIFS